MSNIVVLNAVPEGCELELLRFPPDVQSKLRHIVLSGTNEPPLPTESGITLTQPRSQDAHVEKWIDVVLIHGLEGDPFADIGDFVWRKPGSETIWVRDILPGKLKYFKLHLYKYKSELLAQAFGEELNRHIRSHATRLLKSIFDTFEELETKPNIVLMGNGLGGLIAKQALVYCGKARIESNERSAPSLASTVNLSKRSSESSWFKFAKQHISSVIFLGTPHKGWKTPFGDTYYTRAKNPRTHITDDLPYATYHESHKLQTPSAGDLLPPPIPDSQFKRYEIIDLDPGQPMPQVTGPLFELIYPDGSPLDYHSIYRSSTPYPSPTGMYGRDFLSHNPIIGEPSTGEIQPNGYIHTGRQRQRSHSYDEHDTGYQYRSHSRSHSRPPSHSHSHSRSRSRSHSHSRSRSHSYSQSYSPPPPPRSRSRSQSQPWLQTPQNSGSYHNGSIPTHNIPQDPASRRATGARGELANHGMSAEGSSDIRTAKPIKRGRGSEMARNSIPEGSEDRSSRIPRPPTPPKPVSEAASPSAEGLAGDEIPLSARKGKAVSRVKQATTEARPGSPTSPSDEPERSHAPIANGKLVVWQPNLVDSEYSGTGFQGSGSKSFKDGNRQWPHLQVPL
ncbi:hypothetical protein K440DRAFT_236959 [Wilcoxina mikolae CBS 423.85]|nr:hypothetical protein K440DRAFT_236959 [Wilcoxina mikolae CBS 423.85]